MEGIGRRPGNDAKARVQQETISRRFHDTLAAAILEAAFAWRKGPGRGTCPFRGGLPERDAAVVVLSGLRRKRLRPLIHRQVPANDGGISLGQAYYAALRVAGG
jgi:hydrogenase maturation protein HypF